MSLSSYKFQLGDYVICDCDQKCGMYGKIVNIDHDDEVYQLGTGGIALFDTARFYTKLERELE